MKRRGEVKIEVNWLSMFARVCMCADQSIMNKVHQMCFESIIEISSLIDFTVSRVLIRILIRCGRIDQV